jgi:formylglycine-generating enzyme required for sulfatase activity
MLRAGLAALALDVLAGCNLVVVMQDAKVDPGANAGGTGLGPTATIATSSSGAGGTASASSMTSGVTGGEGGMMPELTCNNLPVASTTPSCDGLPHCCGAARNEDCCASPLVDGGSFLRDNDKERPATVSTFRLDRFEVTVGRFRKFIQARIGGWKPADGSGKHAHVSGGGIAGELGWSAAWSTYVPQSLNEPALSCYGNGTPFATWTAAPGPNDDKPINCLNWYTAVAFCIWDEGFLPTAAEWSYATVGGSQQRLYPWGSTAPDNSFASINKPFNKSDVKVIEIVGSHPKGDGRWGQADLQGSLTEWLFDNANYPVPTPCTDCADLKPYTKRFLGGNLFGTLDHLKNVSSLSGAGETNRGAVYGFRCARTPS